MKTIATLGAVARLTVAPAKVLSAARSTLGHAGMHGLLREQARAYWAIQAARVPVPSTASVEAR